MPVEMSMLSVNFRGTEASEIFLEPVFMDDDIRTQFRRLGNVNNKKKLAFVTELEQIVRSYDGCGFVPVGNMDIYQRTIEVKDLRADFAQCWDEYKDTVYEELLNLGVRRPDITQTMIEAVIRQRVITAVKKDVIRLSHFGDESSVNPAYNSLNGFWTVIYPALTTGTPLVPRTNTGSGSVIADGDGIEMMRDVYEQAPLQLKAIEVGQKFFNVTGSVYDAMVRDYENAGGGDAGFGLLRDGQRALFFRGIPVYARREWDIYATALGTTLPNYIEYTTPFNKVLATDVESPENQFKSWFNEETEFYNTKTRFKMGVDYIHHSLISLGY